MDDQKQLGMLVEQGRWLAKEISELKQDVKQLIAWRWKLYGTNVVISIISSGLFALALALIEGRYHS